MSKWVSGVALVLVLFVIGGVWAYWVSPVVPATWVPPANPGLTGPFAKNDNLRGVHYQTSR